MKRIEIYVSTDIESDGPIPAPNSMLSFGSAAHLWDKTLVATFTGMLHYSVGRKSISFSFAKSPPLRCHDYRLNQKI